MADAEYQLVGMVSDPYGSQLALTIDAKDPSKTWVSIDDTGIDQAASTLLDREGLKNLRRLIDKALKEAA